MIYYLYVNRNQFFLFTYKAIVKEWCKMLKFVSLIYDLIASASTLIVVLLFALSMILLIANISITVGEWISARRERRRLK